MAETGPQFNSDAQGVYTDSRATTPGQYGDWVTDGDRLLWLGEEMQHWVDTAVTDDFSGSYWQYLVVAIKQLRQQRHERAFLEQFGQTSREKDNLYIIASRLLAVIVSKVAQMPRYRCEDGKYRSVLTEEIIDAIVEALRSELGAEEAESYLILHGQIIRAIKQIS